MALFRWLTFLLGSLIVALTSLLCWTSIILLTLLESSDHVVVSVSTNLPSNSKGNASFHGTAYVT